MFVFPFGINSGCSTVMASRLFTYVTLNCETRSLHFFQVINKLIILETFLLTKRIYGSSHLPIFPAVIEINLQV